jgi:hypothetical protein
MTRILLFLALLVLIVLGLSCQDDSPTNINTPSPQIASPRANGITPTSVILVATVNPGGTTCSAHFEYGTTLTYGNATRTRNLGDGSTVIAVAETVGNLTPATSYHWHLVATNEVGTTTSADSQFVTAIRSDSLLKPSAVTSPASDLSSTSARLHGIVNPHGWPTWFYFEYGPTNSYGSKTAERDLGAGYYDIAVDDDLLYLTTNSDYHYRIVAHTQTETVVGADMTFRTLGIPPTGIYEYAAFVVGTDKAILRGYATTADSVRIEYGTTTQYGKSVAFGGGTAASTMTGLTPGSTYHWRIVAWNVWGSLAGGDSSFRMPVSVKSFDLPLRVGTTWKYAYAYTLGGPKGMHTWRITDTDGNGTWLCMDTKTDSVNGTPSAVDSVAFTIKDNGDFWSIQFPEFQGISDRSRSVPKLYDATIDTLTYKESITYGVTGSATTSFVSGIGMIQYFGKAPSMMSSPISLTLTEYSIPR